MERATSWAQSAVWVLGSVLIMLASFGFGLRVFG
jgi:hypothetical protein